MIESFLITEAQLVEIEREIIERRQQPAERAECVIIEFPKEAINGTRPKPFRHPAYPGR